MPSRGCAEIDRESDEEQFFAPQAVGEPAKEHRAKHGAGKVSAAYKTDLGVAELKHRAFLQSPGDGAGKCHLEPIQDPSDTVRGCDECMEGAPGQTVGTHPVKTALRDD